MRNFWDLDYGEVGFKFFGSYHLFCLAIIFIFANSLNTEDLIAICVCEV